MCKEVVLKYEMKKNPCHDTPRKQQELIVQELEHLAHYVHNEKMFWKD